MAAVIALMATLAAQAAQSTTAAAPPSATAEPTTKRNVGQVTYLDIEGGVGYSTNPQFSFGSNTGAGDGYISLHAVHTRITDRTTTLLSAFGQETVYTHHYGSNQSLSVTARHDAAVNEKLRLFVDGNASYDKNGLLDTRIVTLPEVPVLPGAPNIPPQILPPGSDFLAVTGKHYYFSADAGGSLAMSSLDRLNFSAGLQRSVFRSTGRDTSFWSIPASIGYDRQVSLRTDVGGRVDFNYTNYDGPTRVWTVTPELTASIQLSERLSLNGALGVSFSSVDDGIRTHHSTGASGNVAICNAGEHSHLCARAAISQTAATVAGPARTIDGAVDYLRELDANSSIALSVGASHYSQPISTIVGPSISASNYYRAAGSYTRRFGSRLFGGVNLAARKVSQSGPDPKGDLNASLFIRYRFGDLQ